MKFKLKKCPVCNSTRIDKNDSQVRCKKCGYIWKIKEVDNGNIL